MPRPMLVRRRALRPELRRPRRGTQAPEASRPTSSTSAKVSSHPRGGARSARDRPGRARSRARGRQRGSRFPWTLRPSWNGSRKLAELRDAEQAFARTHAELAKRSDALAEQEEALAKRERALTAKEAPPVGLDVLEARIRRLEQRGRRREREPQTFSAGLRGLQERGLRGGRRRKSLYTELLRGALAQLGERRVCNAEVAGSIPARSTAAASSERFQIRESPPHASSARQNKRAPAK